MESRTVSLGNLAVLVRGRSFSLYPPFSTSLVSFHVYCLLSYCCALLQRVFDPMKAPVPSGLHFSDEVIFSAGGNFVEAASLLSVGATVHISRWDMREEMEWSRKVVGCPHSTACCGEKPSAAGRQEKLYVCLLWGCEVVLDSRVQGARDGM